MTTYPPTTVQIDGHTHNVAPGHFHADDPMTTRIITALSLDIGRDGLNFADLAPMCGSDPTANDAAFDNAVSALAAAGVLRYTGGRWSRNFDAPVPPSVGLGVTLPVGSDCYPGTIVAVDSPRRIRIVEDDFTRIDNAGAYSEAQECAYLRAGPVPETRIGTYTLRKNGAWIREGESMKNGRRARLGLRWAYMDPSF